MFPSTQEYGTGRERLGIGQGGSPPPSGRDSNDKGPTLQEYLRFGRLIGERAQDVQRQLDINNASIRVDEASQQYLEEWQNEQFQSYAMFESLVKDDILPPEPAASRTAAVLMRNKNIAVPGLKSLAKFVEQEYGTTAQRPLNASERKLARNKNQAGLATELVTEAEPYELVATTAPLPPQLPELVAKPRHPYSLTADTNGQVSLYGHGLQFMCYYVHLTLPLFPVEDVFFPLVFERRTLFLFGLGLRASLYRTDLRDRLETSLSVSSNMSASFLLPSAPSSVISLSSDSAMSLMLTNLTSVSGIPSISSGTSAKARGPLASLVHSNIFYKSNFFTIAVLRPVLERLGTYILLSLVVCR